MGVAETISWNVNGIHNAYRTFIIHAAACTLRACVDVARFEDGGEQNWS